MRSSVWGCARVLTRTLSTRARMRGTQLNESSVYTSLLSLLLPQRRDARLERAVPFQPLDDGPLRPYYVGPELRLVALPLQIDLLGPALLSLIHI